ncbi:hypothetical protein [Umezawaea tangerina]|uniref:Uncharacterized protein n=1 Tax=Umezawaea tangerina TaxID=84725 RepID=A0A2T0TKI2_9PSEU|nr:hypothetical protein [Umezawaea tangerina]PRY46149.1 hypothetical protein CLV43_101419 [Umezawaea tangerina]
MSEKGRRTYRLRMLDLVAFLAALTGVLALMCFTARPVTEVATAAGVVALLYAPWNGRTGGGTGSDDEVDP